MTAATMSPASNATEYLGDEEVHVWHFAYRRECGRAPLLAVLARYLGGAASDIHLTVGEHGRPRFEPLPDSQLDFNWSHSGDHAAVALARHVAPGIDLERLCERVNALPLAQRFFHPDEVAALVACPVAARSAAFLELWTAKEAVLKATGRGIAFGLHRLHVMRGAAPQLAWLDGDDAAAWQLQRLPLDPGYVAALAWRGGARAVSVRRLASTA
ncbi:MAG TPA: 4'-phosphopantetheinyl transferase superfamily protein [Rhodanobacter sp.]|nr:4'-phosphopantetheinyl transferase superfamily protein [Rhodanobacter sp.]